MSDIEDPFESPKLLLARAAENLQDMDARIRAFFDRKPYARVVEIDPKSGFEIHKLRVTAKVPGGVSAVCADAINNMRHTLDQTVCASAAALGVTNLKNIYFPVCEAEDQLDAVIKSKCRGVDPEVVAYLRGLKPHKGGHMIFWMLSKVAAGNKHQMLAPLGAVSGGIAAVQFNPNTERDFFPYPRWDGAKNELTIAYVRPGTKPNNRFQIEFDVALTQAEIGLEGPAIKLLMLMGDVVANTLAEVEAITLKIIASKS